MAEEDPNFKLFIQDFPEDNVDGVCGKNAFQGYVQMFRIPFPHITPSGKRESGMFKKEIKEFRSNSHGTSGILCQLLLHLKHGYVYLIVYNYVTSSLHI